MMQVQFVEIALSIVLMIVVNRSLGPEGRGLWNAAFIIPLLVSSLGMLAMPDAVLYYASSEPHRRLEIFWDAVLLCLFLGPVYSLVMLLFAHQIMTYVVPNVPHLLFAVAVATIPVNMIVINVSTFMFAQGRTLHYRLPELADRVVGLGGMVLALAVLDWGVTGAVLVTAAGRIVALVVALAILPIRRWWPTGWSLEPARAVGLLRYGAGVTVANVGVKLAFHLDQLLLNALQGPVALGLYATAVRLAQPPAMVATNMRMVWFAEVASREGAIRPEETMRATRRLTIVQAAIYPLYGLACALLIPLVFGEAFRPSVGPLIILLVGSAVLSQSSAFVGALTGAGKPNSLIVPSWVTLAASAVGYVVFVQAFGLYGAAIGYVLGASVFLAMVYRQWATMIGHRELRDFVWRRSDVPDVVYRAASRVGVLLQRQGSRR